jgi:hypothetical protein
MDLPSLDPCGNSLMEACAIPFSRGGSKRMESGIRAQAALDRDAYLTIVRAVAAVARG